MQATAAATAQVSANTLMVYSVGSAPVATNDISEKSASIREYGSCVKGFMAGLCMEGALALGLYGMYHLGRIFH